MKIRFGIPLTLSEIAYAVGGEIINAPCDKTIEYITTDSRECGRNDLYIAIKGQNTDGSLYCSDAMEKGAYCLSPVSPHGIKADDGKSSLARLASYYKGRLRRLKYTVAVTGSVGKSTTKNILREIFSSTYKTHSTNGNYNSEIGAPMTMLTSPEDTEAIILELGMNHRGEISRLSRALKPDIAIITNVGTAHIGNLGSREEIALAKLEVLDGMKDGVLIVPKDDPLLSGHRVLTFGLQENDADYTAKRDGGKAVIFHRGEEIFRSDFTPIGEHLLKNLSASIAAAACAGISISSIKDSISLITDDISRQALINWNNILIYDDSYNASYESVIASLDAFDTWAKERERSVLIGSMLELGDESERLHRALGGAIGARGYRKIYLIGEQAEAMKEYAIRSGFAAEDILTNPDVTDLGLTVRQIKEHSICGEALFLKASNAVRLSEIYKKYT